MKVSIVDYGVGNLYSVVQAFKSVGAEVEVINTKQEILKADRLVLPGVGAFQKAINELKVKNLLGPLKEFAKLERPFLGICLGMQLMADSSEEFGLCEGLGLIAGKVLKIPGSSPQNERVKIPHIGWSILKKSDEIVSWEDSIFRTVGDEDYAYFVHSFSVHVTSVENVLSYTSYGGHSIVAAISKGTLFGCQFHPERSGKVGLKIIKEFTTI